MYARQSEYFTAALVHSVNELFKIFFYSESSSDIQVYSITV